MKMTMKMKAKRDFQVRELLDYERAMYEQRKLRYVARPVEPQPEHRFNEEFVDNVLYVCRGDHGKSEGCRYERWSVPPFAELEQEGVLTGIVHLRRLFKLTEEDCLGCGIYKWVPEGDDALVCGGAPAFQHPLQNNFTGGWSARNAFNNLWEMIYPQHAIESNPWLWLGEVANYENPTQLR